MLPLWVRADRGVKAMKEYTAFPKVPALLEPHHQIVWCHIQDTDWKSLTTLQRCSWCILQLHLIGPGKVRMEPAKRKDFVVFSLTCYSSNHLTRYIFNLIFTIVITSKNILAQTFQVNSLPIK